MYISPVSSCRVTIRIQSHFFVNCQLYVVYSLIVSLIDFLVFYLYCGIIVICCSMSWEEEGTSSWGCSVASIAGLHALL